MDAIDLTLIPVDEVESDGWPEDLLEDMAGFHTPEAKAESHAWMKKNPVNHKNIISHFEQATPEERHVGHNWYSDAHHITKHIAHDTGHAMHTVAGLMSNYSPQTSWHQNIHTAARVAKGREAMGGPGSGIMASSQQKASAHRMLQGEHHSTVLKGYKTKAFAHLIEHGKQTDEKNPQVVVDRHAFSVASGAQASDKVIAHAGLKGKKRYQAVAQAYHKAAKHISATTGQKWEGHQVQAATWLVRQRLNQTQGRSASQGKIAAAHKAKWDGYAKEHHPNTVGKEPGVGFSLQHKAETVNKTVKESFEFRPFRDMWKAASE
jgi:hypothetical protein